VVRGFVKVGDLGAYGKVNSVDTVTIRHDTSVGDIDRKGLAWEVRSLDAPSAFVPRDVPAANVVLTQADCSSGKLGTSVAVRDILEPVSGVTLQEPVWFNAAGQNPAYCMVTGSIAPVDPESPDIRFSVALPASWSYRSVQLGGGGNNGSIPGLTGGGFLGRGWATLGSDSGHQGQGSAWALHDEAIRNFGYMQMKKTHDAAWVIMQRAYGRTPIYSYHIGNSQGGREALTVVQRYPADYDGVIATVPVLSFSNLTLSRALQRIQEIPLANWVQPVKQAAISTHVVRQCDALDGLVDGVVNNYLGCREVFDVARHPPGSPSPWAGIRCPGNVDPNPADNSANACLTDGQISTMEFQHTPYRFAEPVANGLTQFAMWLPNTDPAGNGGMVNQRFLGQEGAAANAPRYTWLGSPHVIEGLFQDSMANVLEYVEGGPLKERRQLLSAWLDSTNPDLGEFYFKGGRVIVMFGTFDSLASSGAQTDYYQSVLQTMGRGAVDQIARLYVLPNAGHGLSGTNYVRDGNGATIPSRAIPNTLDRTSMIIDWVEAGVAPSMSPTVTGGGREMPLCSYPLYPRYQGGSTTAASSYSCVE
jgi:feruloyl esterase